MKPKILTILLLAASVAWGGPAYFIERNQILINEPPPWYPTLYENCTFFKFKTGYKWSEKLFMECAFVNKYMFTDTLVHNDNNII